MPRSILDSAHDDSSRLVASEGSEHGSDDGGGDAGDGRSAAPLPADLDTSLVPASDAPPHGDVGDAGNAHQPAEDASGRGEAPAHADEDESEDGDGKFSTESWSSGMISVAVPVVVAMITVLAALRILALDSDDRAGRSAKSRSESDGSDDDDGGGGSRGGSTSDSDSWDAGLFAALLIVGMMLLTLLLLLVLYRFRFMKVIKGYMITACGLLFALLGSAWILRFFFLLHSALDWISFVFILTNVVAAGVMAQFSYSSIWMSRLSLLATGVLMSWWFLLLLPPWTVWMLLVLLVVFDLAVVMTPKFAPLTTIIETARERSEPIPAPVYPGSKGLQLGLGDVVFYSVLVGRVYLSSGLVVATFCMLSVMGGLFLTLLLLRRYRVPLPAIPVSVTLGLLGYVLASPVMTAAVAMHYRT